MKRVVLLRAWPVGGGVAWPRRAPGPAAGAVPPSASAACRAQAGGRPRRGYCLASCICWSCRVDRSRWGRIERAPHAVCPVLAPVCLFLAVPEFQGPACLALCLARLSGSPVHLG